MKQFNKYIFNKNLFNFKDLFDFKKFLFFFYIAILYIVFSDPQKRQWWDYTVPYSQQFFCDSFPRCFRIIDLNLLNISAFFLDKILKVFG